MVPAEAGLATVRYGPERSGGFLDLVHANMGELRAWLAGE